MNSEWQSVVTATLLGVERNPLQPTNVDGEVGRILSQLNVPEPERQLLLTAGILNLHRKAGIVPRSLEFPSPQISLPAPPETESRCSPESVNFLRIMLAGTQQNLLPEWLQQTAANRQRVPEEILPSILTKGRNVPALRRKIQKVIGNRGEWLARRNPEWYYVLAMSDDQAITKELWETGESNLRIAYLERLREKDPARAREVVMEAWKQEPAYFRSWMVQRFKIHLSMDDEPFLEATLDDRSRTTAEEAAVLLSRLPDSRYVMRMVQRAQTLLQWNKGLLKNSIEVTLPELNQEMKRDCIDRSSGESSTEHGLKARLLINILSAIPPMFWESQWKKTPAEIIRTAKGEWEKTLHESWTQAACAYRSADWSIALLEANPMRKYAAELLYTLPPEKREEIVLQQIKKYLRDSDYERQRFAAQIVSSMQPWSKEFSRAIMNECRSVMRSSMENKRTFFTPLPDWVVLNFPPQMTEELIEFLTTLLSPLQGQDLNQPHTWHYRPIETALEIVRFRHNMNRAITNE